MTDMLNTPFLMARPLFHDLAGLSPEALETVRAQRMEQTWTVKKRGNVAIMEIHGAIARYDSFLLWIRGGTALEDMARDFQACLDDPNVSAILLDVDSPGGEAAGICEFAEMVHAADKPVTAYVGGQAASAALWITAAADEVVVNKTAELGSLGVVFGYRPSAGDLIEIVSTVSPKKRLDPGTDAGRAEIQQRADDLAAVFVAQVAQYRGVTEDQVKSDFGQGGMMIAEKAIAAGMADKYGSLEDVITSLQAQTMNNFYGGTSMGLTTELRALVAGKADADIEAAFASIGYAPTQTGTTAGTYTEEELQAAKAEAMEAGKAQGAEDAKTTTADAEAARVAAVMEKCRLAGVTSAKFTADMVKLTAEDAGQKIMDAQADAAMKAEVFSTVNPMTNGGVNPLVADAKKRAEARK